MFHVEQNIPENLTIIYKIFRYFVLGMQLPNKILSCTLLLSYLTIASFTVLAQSKLKHSVAKKENKKITLGIQSGRELLFNSTPLLHSRQSKIHYGINKTVVLRKPINSHLKAEAGLMYGSMQRSPFTTGFQTTKISSAPGKLSAPVTLQYYFLPEKCRVRPYCGAGLQGNLLINAPGPAPFTDGAPVTSYNTQPDTKYITILFTQGVTFEVNTKIEVNQSFHFIPGGANKVIGIDLGIGYKIP